MGVITCEVEIYLFCNYFESSGIVTSQGFRFFVFVWSVLVELWLNIKENEFLIRLSLPLVYIAENCSSSTLFSYFEKKHCSREGYGSKIHN